MIGYTQAHLKALETDHAWHEELVRLFGKRAGDVRYTPQGKGEAGSELRRIYDARMAAQAEWHAELNARKPSHGFAYTIGCCEGFGFNS